MTSPIRLGTALVVLVATILTASALPSLRDQHLFREAGWLTSLVVMSAGGEAAVWNARQLRSLTRYETPVLRHGYLLPGDGGDALYTHGAAPCSLNGGAGDDGAQVPDAAGTGCWTADLSKPISAAVWGVRSDGVTDDGPAWTAALTALGALNNGGTLLMPSRKTCSVLKGTLYILVSDIKVTGAGPFASCFGLAFASGNGLAVGGDATRTAYVRNVTLEHVSVQALVPRTSGGNFSVFQARNTRLESIMCKGPKFWICVSIDGRNDGMGDTLDTSVEHLSEDGGGQTGVCVGCMGAKYPPISTVFHHLELTNNDGAAEELINVGGLSQEDINTDFNYIGFWAHPTTGKAVGGVFSSNTAYDASATVGFLIDTSGGGNFNSGMFNALWVASCGSPITQNIVHDTTPSPCMQMTGKTNANSILTSQFNVFVSTAFKDCINLDRGVVDVSFSGQLTACGLSTYGGNQGIYSNGANRWSWSGTIGATTVQSTLQAFSVYLTGATDFVRLSGDIGRTLTGAAIFNDAAGTNMDFADVLPAQPWIATKPTMSCGSGTLATAGQSAAMRYQMIGRTVRFDLHMAAGLDGRCRGLAYSLPFPAADDATGIGRESGSGRAVTTSIRQASRVATTQFFDSLPTGANGQRYTISAQYERQ